MSQRPSPPRGMRDLLPGEVRRRARLIEIITSTYRSYGFEQVETPLLEDIDRLLGSEAGENDKLIYKVLKRGLEWPQNDEASAVDLGLRYDLTVPLARYYATNSAELPSPFKAIQFGPVFRAERPQKGRYRQFTQSDIDIIGDPSTFAEIELLCATADALKKCGAGAFTIRMNHRELLNALVTQAGFDSGATGAVLITLDKLDKIGADGVQEELERIDTKAAARLIELTESDEIAAPEATSDLFEIQQAVGVALPWVRVRRDASLVRGMGYYTGPIFEIAHDDLGMSLAGGGRYDGMVKKLSGVDAPATGMSIGFERLCMLDAAVQPSTEQRVVLLRERSTPVVEVLAASTTLRAQGAEVRIEVASKNARAQLSRLASFGFTQVATLSDGEIELKVLHNEEGTS